MLAGSAPQEKAQTKTGISASSPPRIYFIKYEIFTPQFKQNPRILSILTPNAITPGGEELPSLLAKALGKVDIYRSPLWKWPIPH